MSDSSHPPRLAPARRVLAVVVVLLVAAGCATSGPGDSGPGTEDALVIGSGPGTAPGIAAEIYAEVLRHEGARVADRVVTGTIPELLDGVDAGRVDLFGAFSGALLADLAPGSSATSTDAVYDDLNRSLPQGVSVGDPTPVVDQLQVVVAAATATAAGVDELAECSRLPAGLPVVSDREPDAGTLAALAEVGCRLGPFRRVADVAQVTAEVTAGRAVGLVSTLSSAGTDADLTTLADRAAVSRDDTADGSATAAPAGEQPAIRAQNLVPVYATGALDRDRIKAVNKVAGELTTADLASMAQAVSTGASSQSAVVANWLTEHSL